VSGRGSFIPLQLRHRQQKALPLGEAEVIAPLLDMVSIKDGYREIAEYLLSDVIVVPNLTSGLALWNRNGYYCTIVTPDGEVIDPMGTVTGGSSTPLEGNLLTQRRRFVNSATPSPTWQRNSLMKRANTRNSKPNLNWRKLARRY
jgi:chromosome segregation protein